MPTVTAESTAQVRGRKIFYREAGDPSAPTILLLHGLLGSSAEFRDLIPALTDKFHLIAPDYIGFGQSEVPAPDVFDYTFENLIAYVAGLAEVLGLQSYKLYMHDCGGPVGFRLFVQNPARVTGFIIQNANAYIEGVSAACLRAFAPLWKRRTLDTERAAQDFVIEVSLKPTQVDNAAITRPLSAHPEIACPETPSGLINLLEDYKTNVALYPDWQAAFREHAPPTLIIWGKHDLAFIPPGARAYLDDLPQAKLVWLDAGHSVLEYNWAQVAVQIQAAFISRLVSTPTALIARERAARMCPD